MPRPFLTQDNGAIRVYRCYKDPESPDNRMPSEWWFSTDPSDIDLDWPGESQFDVREIDPDGDSYMWSVSGGFTVQVPSTDAAIRRVIRKAIREGRLTA
jgi:hypothetical protein